MHPWLSTHRLDLLYAKLVGGVPPQHPRHERFLDVGPGEHGDGVPGTRGIVVGLA